jgi:inosine-uridine nucleoside N-ribohydrolase
MVRLLAGFLLLLTPLFAARDLVIFDTDSCPFCDDGAALTMLLRSPEQVNVLGITVVPGNVWPTQGAEYMFHILDLLHRPQIPVYTGAQTPLINTTAMAHEFARRWPGVEYSGAFAINPAEVKPAPGAKLTRRNARADAVEYLIGEIERHPGEITILALGPMTNIALALRMKPAIETKIKRIVFMGGNLKVGGNASTSAEFNFWFDPEAARIVLRSRIRQKVMFGLDICNTAPLHKAEFDQIVAAQTPITELYKEELGNRYPSFLKNPNATGYIWDSLAAAYLLDPAFVTKSESHYLDVLTVWNKYYGATVPLDRDRRVAPDATPVIVATELDFKRVFGLYKEKLTRRE